MELNKDGVLEHCNPIYQMLHEHSLGRGFVKGLSEAVEKGEKQKPLKTREGIANSYKSISSKKTIFLSDG